MPATLTEVRFQSGNAECAGVFVEPDGADGSLPCVVLAHGFGAVKEGGPIRSAERYAAVGIAGLAFDYRHFGGSAGEPRQLLDVGRQREDWRAAIAFARSLAGVDPDRIALWGSSFGGGHVIEIAAGDSRVAAIVSQVPHIDGIATLRAAGVADMGRLAVAGLRDLVAALVGREQYTIPIVGPPGRIAAMNSPDAQPGYTAMYDDGFDWRNEIGARSALQVAMSWPGRKARDVRCPALVQVALDDVITPPAPALEAAGRMPQGELVTYAGLGHFDVYRGDAFERAIEDQIQFLTGRLLP